MNYHRPELLQRNIWCSAGTRPNGERNMTSMSNDDGERCTEHGLPRCEECNVEQIEFSFNAEHRFIGGRQEFARRKNRVSSLRSTTKTKTAPLDSQPPGAMFDAGFSIRRLVGNLKQRTRHAFQRGSTVAIYGPILALAVLIYLLIFS